MKHLLFLFLFHLLFLSNAFGQNYYNKDESVITSKKWTVTNVKGKNAVFELGEVLDFRIDKSFIYRKNNNMIHSGKWFMDKKTILLNIDSEDGDTNIQIPRQGKIKKFKRNLLVIRFRFDRKETVTFK